MTISPKTRLLLILSIIIAAIVIIEATKPNRNTGKETKPIQISESTNENSDAREQRIAKKQGTYPVAREIVAPAGFINTDEITIGELIGEKVILIDIMTYSCINCIRTFPYINDWYDKYRDEGLEIVGIHTPEFAFEEDYDNVAAAMKKHGIEFPVVLDNEYGTWNAYENRWWPRKFLIDIDGFVVYSHIGEGSYDETEEKIQELLEERKQALNEDLQITKETTDIAPKQFNRNQSPEIYLGAWRNDNFGNGDQKAVGVQTLSAPETLERDAVYLDGTWNITREYSENDSSDARIIFPYHAQNVFMVLEADRDIEITILRDGEPLSDEFAGEDVVNSKAVINESRLYRLIEDSAPGEHLFELIVSTPGLKAYTFTFG